MTEKNSPKYQYGLGRRKEASGRVRLFMQKGESTVNDKSLEEYFNKNKLLLNKIDQPLRLCGFLDKAYFTVKIKGGGLSGQAEAISLGLARAIVGKDESFRTTLRKSGFLTRDQREKERKKYGLKRARKAPQFSKR